MHRSVRIVRIAVPVAIVAVALVAIGRASAPSATRGSTPNQAVTVAHDRGYRAGLAAGQVEGRAEGRALQASDALPPTTRAAGRAAFAAGYTAGANDVFAGYDGGWSLGTRYVITLERGTGGITYRIGTREEASP